MTSKIANEALEEVRLDHFPGVISKRIRKLYRERRDEADLGTLTHLVPRQLINKLVIQYESIQGREDKSPNNHLLDHWGSIEGGKTLVTEPYMHSSVWRMAERFAEAANLDMEYIDDSGHNPKQSGPASSGHRHCSRICFRIKEHE